MTTLDATGNEPTYPMHTPLNDFADHQIRLFKPRRQEQVHVGCTCRPAGRAGSYVPFGLPANTREAKALYNDMTKHDQSKAPFTSEHLLEER